MRLLSPMSQLSRGILLIATLLASESGRAQVVGFHTGIPMVPSQCRSEGRESMNVDNSIVFYNKVISFNLGSVTIRSGIMGNVVEVIYGEEPGTAIFNIGSIIPYRASDIRLYHGTLDNRPVLFWEEVVENVMGRGGVLEYRGRAIFSLCTGLINRNGRAPTTE